MAHIGQELGLGQIGRLGATAGNAEMTRYFKLPDGCRDRRQEEKHGNSNDPALRADHVFLQDGVGLCRFELAAALVELLLHVARDLTDAGAETLVGLHRGEVVVIAKLLVGLDRATFCKQQLSLDMRDFRNPFLAECPCGDPAANLGEICAGFLDIAQLGVGDGPHRQQPSRQKGRRPQLPTVRLEAPQHLFRRAPGLSDVGAQTGVIDCEALQPGPQSKAMVSGRQSIGQGLIPDLNS